MNESTILTSVIAILAVLLIFLMTKRMFWLTIFLLLTIASFFAIIASIVNFQILAALAFLVLTRVLAEILARINV